MKYRDMEIAYLEGFAAGIRRAILVFWKQGHSAGTVRSLQVQAERAENAIRQRAGSRDSKPSGGGEG